MRDLLLYSLATARISRLVTEDRISSPIRDGLAPLRSRHPEFDYWMSCPWCQSPYIAAFLLTSSRLLPRTTNTVVTIAAISQVASLIRTRLDPPSPPSFQAPLYSTSSTATTSEGTPPAFMTR